VRYGEGYREVIFLVIFSSFDISFKEKSNDLKTTDLSAIPIGSACYYVSM
jgi:hypothetical protein